MGAKSSARPSTEAYGVPGDVGVMSILFVSMSYYVTSS
jgi:hypothetical protein